MNLTFENVTVYRVAMFGVHAITCRKVEIETGVKYAQYNDAIRVTYVKKGCRARRAFILDYDPWLRIVDSSVAIEPGDPRDKDENGLPVWRYTSYDPRYVTDFEYSLERAGIACAYQVGAGSRDSL